MRLLQVRARMDGLNETLPAEDVKADVLYSDGALLYGRILEKHEKSSV